MLARRLMHRGCKARISASSATATGNHHAFIGSREVMNFLARICVDHDGANGDFQRDALAVLACLVRAFSVTSSLRLVFRIEPEMDERIVALTRLHDDVAASAAIAAGRPAARNKLLPSERHAAIAAVSRLNPDCGFIDEQEGL